MNGKIGGRHLEKGIVFNIQRYSIHDGPGIRTTVFLKGCPMNCLWCHNPESQKQRCEIMIKGERCIGCGECVKSCSYGAISGREGFLKTDSCKCVLCGKCVEACPTEARSMAGKIMTVSEVIKQIEQDIIFYDESGGGVTFSGGEPLMQPEFLNSLLVCCQKRHIHTAVDTSGHASWDVLSGISQFVDLFLYDIKLMDDERHKKYMGVSNRLLLDNLKKLSWIHSDIYIRLPLIPGINDDEDNINRTGEFISSLYNVKQVNILPYHGTAIDKYTRLGRRYALMNTLPPSEEAIARTKQILGKYGLNIKMGG
jgi:pyruvate formate lyase activating enzyme